MVLNRLPMNGVRRLDLFAKAFESLLATVESARKSAPANLGARQTAVLPAALSKEVENALKSRMKCA